MLGGVYPRSLHLLALALLLCHCGKKATMVIRVDAEGRALMEGAQVEVGGNDRYISLCRIHWREAVGDRATE